MRSVKTSVCETSVVLLSSCRLSKQQLLRSHILIRKFRHAKGILTPLLLGGSSSSTSSPSLLSVTSLPSPLLLLSMTSLLLKMAAIGTVSAVDDVIAISWCLTVAGILTVKEDSSDHHEILSAYSGHLPELIGAIYPRIWVTSDFILC